MARYTISSSFLGVVLSVRLAFSKRSWPYLAACAVPWLLCAGQRCVTRLAALGSHRRSRSGYYRWLSDGKWRLEVFFRCLFDLIVGTFRVSHLTLVLFRHALAEVGAWHLRDRAPLRPRGAAAGGLHLGPQLGGAGGERQTARFPSAPLRACPEPVEGAGSRLTAPRAAVVRNDTTLNTYHHWSLFFSKNPAVRNFVTPCVARA